MRLLVLGGTRFVGRHLAAAALARGHTVTLVHRGLTSPDLFPQAEHLLGDREGDLSFLAGRSWDAVLDVCGYTPGPVHASAERLAGAVDRYVFISTVSVYAEPRLPGAGEDAPLTDPAEGDDGKVSYGGLKAQCERAVTAVFPDRALIVRPGLIAGPFDWSGRFSYWPWRFACGGEVLAPGRPELPVQFIDARDLGEWLVRSVEAGTTGIYNAMGFDRPLTLGGVLATCREAVAAPETTRLTWVDEAFLQENGVTPWTGLPLWIPGPEGAAFLSADNRRARAAGLTFRPVAETARDTWAWLRELGGALPMPGDPGPLSPEREAELLRAWSERAC
ncbi:MAG TPA: epimerase [Thermoanaerobaculia bacterium]|jgi:2'-hydroxyisoflavone reductase|nr:epimerase [Thermoanaerobaculia bacterium]